MSEKNRDRRLLFGSPVLLLRGGHEQPIGGHYRLVRATLIGAIEGMVICRMEQDDPHACVGYCTQKGDVGRWGRSIMFRPSDLPPCNNCGGTAVFSASHEHAGRVFICEDCRASHGREHTDIRTREHTDIRTIQPTRQP